MRVVPEVIRILVGELMSEDSLQSPTPMWVNFVQADECLNGIKSQRKG